MTARFKTYMAKAILSSERLAGVNALFCAQERKLKDMHGGEATAEDSSSGFQLAMP
jgi:hypothetical protein